MPALIARARHLAATLNLGVHGRRRSGQGEEFWQYRPAGNTDSLRDIDWRRSARGDAYFVRQTEWHSAQAVHFWIDSGASMRFSDGNPATSKLQRAQVLALAVAMLLSKAGERFAVLEDAGPPKTGETQIAHMAMSLSSAQALDEYQLPPPKPLKQGSRAVFLSDFLGDWDETITAVSKIADQDVQGVLCQVLDPYEVAFPYQGRTIFESVKGGLSFESRRADALRLEYLDRLEQRTDALKNLARATGWRYSQHQTDSSAQSGLLWLYSALEWAA
ncbi:DUF58 domain-containing protein [Amylibacter marinus]|nr:DUF58 domain-containing protein [Amylibacter marinus]